MAAVLAKRKTGTVNTRISVVEHPECDSYSIKLLRDHQRRDLVDVMRALEEERPKNGKVVVFAATVPMALVYANHIAVHFDAPVVECVGHATDTCTCVDDYLGVVDHVIIIESPDRASMVAGAMGNRLQREPADYPQKFGAARLFSI